MSSLCNMDRGKSLNLNILKCLQFENPTLQIIAGRVLFIKDSYYITFAGRSLSRFWIKDICKMRTDVFDHTTKNKTSSQSSI